MTYLVDANLSPRVAGLLLRAGHDAVAVRDIGLGEATDEQILDRALADDRVIISNDSDFGTLLAVRHSSKPSFILIRSSDPLSPDEQAALIAANVGRVVDDLAAGAVVTFVRGRLRVRRLPVR